MVIGIIAAEELEMLAIKEYMSNIKEKEIYNLHFYEGEISGKECVIVKSGVGKVNSARTTQILIDKYNVNCVINIGSAGATNTDLQIGDIVIADKLIQYDFDLTGVGDYEKGEIFEVGKYMTTDNKMVELCETAIKSLNEKGFNYKIGIIGSADMFCANTKLATSLKNEFNIECVEMEGAAIAQVCNLDLVPCLVIRGISDVPDGNNKVDFHQYLKKASKRVAEILSKLIDRVDKGTGVLSTKE